jgi:hypothetical protein
MGEIKSPGRGATLVAHEPLARVHSSPSVRLPPRGMGRPGDMKFPRAASTDAETSARERLDEAREEQRRLTERRDDAEPGSREVQAAADLSAAGDDVAAREAWARWARED